MSRVILPPEIPRTITCLCSGPTGGIVVVVADGAVVGAVVVVVVADAVVAVGVVVAVVVGVDGVCDWDASGGGKRYT